MQRSRQLILSYMVYFGGDTTPRVFLYELLCVSLLQMEK